MYGDIYDDREEDSRPGGEDWVPGESALHKSLAVFQRELETRNIKLSTSKIRKILITGGCWTTERSREVASLYNKYAKKMKPEETVKKIATTLDVSIPTVCMNLPYGRVVYGIEGKTSNAKRCDKWRTAKQKDNRNTI